MTVSKAVQLQQQWHDAACVSQAMLTCTPPWVCCSISSTTTGQIHIIFSVIASHAALRTHLSDTPLSAAPSPPSGRRSPSSRRTTGAVSHPSHLSHRV
jgi:hypothetical protein